MTSPQTENKSIEEKELEDLIGLPSVSTEEQSPEEQPAEEKPKKRSRVKKILLIILLVLLALLLVAGGLLVWMYRRGQQDLLPSEPPAITPPESLVEGSDGDRVVYNGTVYEYNHNVTAMLVIGVDKKDIQEESTYGQNGQADTLFLTTLDTKTGDVHIIPLSRETMVEVDRYAVDGTYLGVEKTQLCLAYSYAANGEEGCDNVARSVSRLLYGIPINSYVAIDLKGVQTITDTIGGITITGLEDVADPRTGEIIVYEGEETTLNGKQALTYMRHRDTDAQANNRRMQRLKQFFTAFIGKAGGNLKENISLLPKYYNTASPYIVTDITLSKMTYLVGCTLAGNNWKNPEYVTINGRTIDGKDHAEFYATSSSAYEAVLAAFYNVVETPTTTEATAPTAAEDTETTAQTEAE